MAGSSTRLLATRQERTLQTCSREEFLRSTPVEHVCPAFENEPISSPWSSLASRTKPLDDFQLSDYSYQLHGSSIGGASALQGSYAR